MAVFIPTQVSLMQLLMGGKDQLCYQHRKLLKGQLLVLVCVQVLHDVIYESFILFLLLWVKWRRLLELRVTREEDPGTQWATRWQTHRKIWPQGLGLEIKIMY